MSKGSGFRTGSLRFGPVSDLGIFFVIYAQLDYLLKYTKKYYYCYCITDEGQ